MIWTVLWENHILVQLLLPFFYTVADMFTSSNSLSVSDCSQFPFLQKELTSFGFSKLKLIFSSSSTSNFIIVRTDYVNFKFYYSEDRLRGWWSLVEARLTPRRHQAIFNFIILRIDCEAGGAWWRRGVSLADTRRHTPYQTTPRQYLSLLRRS